MESEGFEDIDKKDLFFHFRIDGKATTVASANCFKKNYLVHI